MNNLFNIVQEDPHLSIAKLGKIVFCWGAATITKAYTPIQIKLPFTLKCHSINATDSESGSVCSAFMKNGNTVYINATRKSDSFLYTIVGFIASS